MFKSIVGFICLGLISLFSMSNVGGRAKQGGEGNTGAPGDQSYICSKCHGGGKYNIASEILIKDDSGNIVTEYQPATIYKLSFTINTVSGSNPKGYGFQLLALLDSANTNAGILSNPSTDAQITSIGSRKYLEHKKSSPNKTFTADWTSPDAGQGAVTFYGVGNGNNTNLDPSGDTIDQADPLFIMEASAGNSKKITVLKLFLFPNPVNERILWKAPAGISNLEYFIESMNTHTIQIPLEDVAKTSFDVRHLAPGMYILWARSINGKTLASQSFIKI